MVKVLQKLCLVFMLFPVCLFSQQERVIDSLEALLKTTKADTNRVKTLNKLAVKYQNSAKYDESLLRANEALELANKLNFQTGIADVYNDMANTYYLKGDYLKAIECHQPAIKIRQTLKQQQKLGRSYNNVGSCYERVGEYKKALECHVLSLKIKEELKDSVGIQRAYNNMGNLHFILKNFGKALSYYKESYNMSQHLGDEGQMSMTLDNIAGVYEGMGNYKEAINYELAAQKIAVKIDDRYMIGATYSNMGDIHNNLQQYDEGKQNHLKALKIWEEDKNEDGISTACIRLGQYYYRIKKDYKTAAAYLERSLTYKQHKRVVGDAYNSLAELYEAMGDYKNARRYSVLYMALKDELYNETLTQQMGEIQVKYETEKKEKENLDLRRKNEIQQLLLNSEKEKRRSQLIIGLVIIVLIALTSYFLYNRRKLKHQAHIASELANQEKIRFRAIIEAEENERSRIAQDLHDGLGQMLAASRMHVSVLKSTVSGEEKAYAEKALEILNDAYQEVRNISHNMMPNALVRLGLIPAIKELVENINAAKVLTIDFSTNIDRPLGKSMDITIYRIVQEIINNMMKHAKADHIVMEINRTNDNLNISIRDNGVGFDTSIINESKGLGWKGIYSRVSMLNGTIKLDSVLKEGTFIYINLKLKEDTNAEAQ